MSWTFRELQCFDAVATEASFTDAALLVGISQASVSRTIAGVETRLGEHLIRRTTRSCELTALGHQLLPQVRKVLAENAKLDELFRTRHSQLRLGYSWAAVGTLTTPLIRGWESRNPTVDLQLIRHNSPTAGLAEGRCDAAILRTQVDSTRFEFDVIGLERRVVAFAADDPQWQRRRKIRMREIAERVIVIDPRTGTTSRSLWVDGEAPQRFVESSDVEEWLDAIAAGTGVGTTAEATATHHPRQGVVYRPISDGPRVPVFLAWWRSDPPPGLTALIETLSELYSSAGEAIAPG